jgi:hypothetical protein
VPFGPDTFSITEKQVMKTTAALIWLVWILVPAASAETITVAVAAGKHDRKDVPVCVPLLLSAKLPASSNLIFLQASDKDPAFVQAQLTAPALAADNGPVPDGKVRRELYFILPTLAAGKSLDLTAPFPPRGEPARIGNPVFSWHDTGGKFTELRYQGQPVLRYVYRPLDDTTKEAREETYKVFHHLFDPSGKRLVTKDSGGLYTHHRGLFYGFRKVRYGDGIEVDTWHCTGDTYQAHERFLGQEGGRVLGRHRVAITWHGKNKEAFARETREVTVFHIPGGTLVEWVSRLETLGGPIQLDGDPQHAGFHFRADNEVAEKTKDKTIFTRPDGRDQPGKTRNWPEVKSHVNLPWDAMTFVLGGTTYTAAYLDRPDNPKEARFSERDYGRFGSYFVREVTADKPLTVRYRIWLQEGPMSVAEIAARSADFVEPVEVHVK